MSASQNRHRAECDECGEVVEFPLHIFDSPDTGYEDICTNCHDASYKSETEEGDPDVMLEHHIYDCEDIRRMVLKLPDSGDILFTHDRRRGVWFTVGEGVSYDLEYYCPGEAEGGSR